jgi:hypothetical protein
MADSPNVTSMAPASGPVNQPTSGTYGEVTELEKLKTNLAGTAPDRPAVAPTPPAPGPVAGPGAPPAPPGLPSALLAPTARPDVPVSTPLQAPPVNPVSAAGTPAQQRLAIVDALIEHPEASESVKDWARVLRSKLVRASTGG